EALPSGVTLKSLPSSPVATIRLPAPSSTTSQTWLASTWPSGLSWRDRRTFPSLLTTSCFITARSWSAGLAWFHTFTLPACAKEAAAITTAAARSVRMRSPRPVRIAAVRERLLVIGFLHLVVAGPVDPYRLRPLDHPLGGLLRRDRAADWLRAGLLVRRHDLPHAAGQVRHRLATHRHARRPGVHADHQVGPLAALQRRQHLDQLV